MQNLFYACLAIFLYLMLDLLIKTKLFKNSFRHSSVIVKLLRILLLFLVTITAVSEMGIDIDAFLTSFGITGLAVSLASREVLSNLISGFAIQIYRPFKLGDTITIKGHTGKVLKINIRETIISSENGRVVIPNRLLLAEPLCISSN